MEGPSDKRANDKAADDKDLKNKLSVRCSQFLSKMPQLEDKWQHDTWFDDLLKADKLHEKISLNELRCILVDFIKEVKDKYDIQKRCKDISETWISSEIEIIHKILKEEVPISHSSCVPDHLKASFNELENWLRTIHVKLDSMLKSQLEGNVTSGQISASIDTTKQAMSSERKDGRAAETDKALKGTLKELQKEKKTLTDDLKQAKAIHDKSENELANVVQAKTALEEKNKELDATVAGLQNQKQQLEKQLEKAVSDLASLKRDIEALAKKYNDSEDTVKKLSYDNNELKLRYSALAGSKMSHDNPDIADLSDPYRPTKIAEMFSQLYDDEWSDAFVILSKQEEEGAISILMKILQDVNKFCRQEADSLRQLLKSAIQETCTLLSLENRQGTIQGKQAQQTKQRSGGRSDGKQSDKVSPADFVKDQKITELIRGSALQPVKALQQKFQKDWPMKQWKIPKAEEKNLTLYINKCVELCWLMAIQSPPVAIDDKYHEYKNTQFDERHFKLYTKKGQLIDYIVWPVLYIPGGGILGKGVAQCK